MNRRPHSEQIVWLFNCIGTPDSLLYWNHILPAYLQAFPNSAFYTARPPSQPIPGTDKVVRCLGSVRIPLGKRRNTYERQIVLASPSVVGMLRKQSPRVVVISEFLSYSLILAICRRWLSKTKLLLLLESDPIRGIASRNKPWTKWIRRFISRRMDYFLTNNDAGAAYLKNELGVSQERILVHPYLVSMPAHGGGGQLPAAAEVDPAKIVFLFVGQIVERKGVAELVDAVAELNGAEREQATFWLVGEGAVRKTIQDQIERHGLAGCVKLLGPQPYERLGAFYRRADVAVMPTLDDYRALVGFEAISNGLPLLHSKYDGAVTEILEEGQNGFRIDPYDKVGFAERIRWMIQHTDRLGEMGRRSGEISRRFTVENAVEGICVALDRCLS